MGGGCSPGARRTPGEQLLTKTHDARYRDLRANRLTPPKQGGARTPEGSGGRGVGFVELDIAASGTRAAQGVIRIEFGRIDDDAGLRQPDDELIVPARFASVSGCDDPIDVTEKVRPRRAANETGAGRLA